MIDTAGLTDLSRYGHEAVGAALALVAWESRGHTASNEDEMARVCGLSRTRWGSRREAILAARSVLLSASQPRATFKRTAMSKATRELVLKRDGRECRYCGDTEGPFHIDHIVPVSRGGTDRLDNLCVACAPCNFAKAASIGSEWNY